MIFEQTIQVEQYEVILFTKEKEIDELRAALEVKEEELKVALDSSSRIEKQRLEIEKLFNAVRLSFTF